MKVLEDVDVICLSGGGTGLSIICQHLNQKYVEAIGCDFKIFFWNVPSLCFFCPAEFVNFPVTRMHSSIRVLYLFVEAYSNDRLLYVFLCSSAD